MEQSEQDRTGLVDAHAYAVLDLRKITVADQNKRLLLVKNPWTHLRWKGRFSEKDLGSWTPELRKALDYNPEDAQQFDDGVFWIDYESVCAFFDVIYVNWDPALFPFSYALHASWSAGVGPVKDLYSIAENPQYYLKVNNRYGKASVWILLSRHITDKADFADNKEYITLLVYKSGKKDILP
ncbi:calpain 7 [Aphelenchoides avenae]|nr:calpain 7 [Aphelenchus avenae]